MEKSRAKSHMIQNRINKKVKNPELVEFLKLFKTSVILDALGWENNNANGQKLRVQRLIWGNFKLEELLRLHTFILSLTIKNSVDYHVVKEIERLKKKKALKEELENL